PQFDWTKSRMPHRAQPVPPIFQPEVAARAIYWAAHHNRPELYVGFPSEKAIWANRIMPRLLARYLARTGFSSQQTSEPEDPNRPNNLYESVDGDYGAHGRFDARSTDSSQMLWATERRGRFALGALAATLAGALLFSRLNGKGSR